MLIYFSVFDDLIKSDDVFMVCNDNAVYSYSETLLS